MTENINHTTLFILKIYTFENYVNFFILCQCKLYFTHAFIFITCACTCNAFQTNDFGHLLIVFAKSLDILVVLVFYVPFNDCSVISGRFSVFLG